MKSIIFWDIPYLLECNAHLFWPNYVAKIRVHIRFDGALDSTANLKNIADHAVVRPRVFLCFFFLLVYKN
jgi:hypothetical protein